MSKGKKALKLFAANVIPGRSKLAELDATPTADTLKALAPLFPVNPGGAAALGVTVVHRNDPHLQLPLPPIGGPLLLAGALADRGGLQIPTDEQLRRFVLEHAPDDEPVLRPEPNKQLMDDVTCMDQTQARVEMARKRSTAVRLAFWENTPEGDIELASLDDALAQIDVPASPLARKTLFFLLPEAVFAGGIHWGFSDTEVRREIAQFAWDNEEAVRAGLLGWPPLPGDSEA